MTTSEMLLMEFAMVEILVRLPVKTLIRLKSVCKFLNSLITSQDFTRLYLRHLSVSSSAADNCLILAGCGRINCYQLDPHATTTTTTTFVYDRCSLILSAIGACNGLLCIRLIGYKSSGFSILNPTTRICRYIDSVQEEARASHNHGFGFDHENLDYRIVVISNYIDKSAVKTRITRVYSLNRNSWRVIDKTFPTDTMEITREGGVLIDSKLLHWMFWVPELRKHSIRCFDICKNKWTDDVLLPRFYYNSTSKNKNYLIDFGVVDDCLFSTFKDGNENRYNIWVMKEYGVQESWTMLLSIPISNCVEGEVINPVTCCQNSGKILVRRRFSCEFFWYNKVDGGISEAKFDVPPYLLRILQAYMCSNTLVHVPDGQRFEDVQHIYGLNLFL